VLLELRTRSELYWSHLKIRDSSVFNFFVEVIGIDTERDDGAIAFANSDDRYLDLLTGWWDG
jgi:hypothetical protein